MFSVVILAVGITACSKVPAEDVAAADQSLQAAQAAGAADYAPESLQAARDARAELDAELEAQEDRFALRRSYDKATELAKAAQQAAAAAERDAADGKARTAEEATQMIELVRTSLVEVNELLAKAPKGKGNEADLAMLKSDLGAIEASLEGMDAALASQNYLEAKTKATAAAESLDSVRNAITQAIEMSRKR